MNYSLDYKNTSYKKNGYEDIDYKKLGLRCGLEIHQQLDTAKLFCSCPSLLREEKPDITIERNLRAVAGESGQIDIAVLHEKKKNKHFIYEGYKDTTCLVEFDDEPPHKMNVNALRAAIEVSLLLKANIVDTIQTMRKIVIDGSNTSGFQRTALIARNGNVDTADGEVSIKTICIEEDAARIISENNDLDDRDRYTDKKVVYRLDRLGIPLIEIGTGADIYSPKQCLEVAEKLGMILRSTGKVKRGIGTIRQDINVSIKDGARIEIKGAQELKQLPILVENEVIRQLNLLEIKDELKKRNIEKKGKMQKDSMQFEVKDNIQFEAHDISDVFAGSAVKIAVEGIKHGAIVMGLKLKKYKGILLHEVQQNKKFGTELSDRAKVVAGVGGIIHSDEFDRNEPKKYGLDVELCDAIEGALGINPKDDAYVLVIAKKEIAEKALIAVFERLQEALHGVPAEVRKANPDGTTSYLRPLPGAARMYPETDVPLIMPETEGALKEIKLPELIEKKMLRFISEFNLTDELASNIARSSRVNIFEQLAKKHRSIKPAYIAEVLVGRLLELKRDYNIDGESIKDSDLVKVFNLLEAGKIHKDIMSDVLIDVTQNKLDINKYAGLKTEELHKELLDIIKKNPTAPFGALMGIAVGKLKGKASGQKIAEMLKELMNGHNSMKSEKKVK